MEQTTAASDRRKLILYATNGPDLDDVYRLTELCEGLDGWLSRGGAVPRVWRSDDLDSPEGWSLPEAT